MTLPEFNKIYKYQSDLEKYGFSEVWEIPKVSGDGFIYADCESYCRYLKNNLPEFKYWEYYYCKLSGNGHCVLHKNGDIIDCNVRRIVSTEQYYRMFAVTNFSKYSKFTLVSKIIVGNVLRFISKYKKI